MVKERKCDVDMLAFLMEKGREECSIDDFCEKHELLYSNVKSNAIGGKIKVLLVEWDRPVLLNYVLSEIALAVPIKDSDLAMAFKNELSDETIDVLTQQMKRLRGKGPSRELLTWLIGGNFDAKRHVYDRAITKLNLGAGQTAITSATHLSFDPEGRVGENGVRFRAQTDPRWLKLVLSTLDPKFKKIIPRSTICDLSQLVSVPQPDGTRHFEAIGIKFLQILLDEGFKPEAATLRDFGVANWAMRMRFDMIGDEGLVDPKKRHHDSILAELKKNVRQAGPSTKKWVREYDQMLKKRHLESEEERIGKAQRLN